MRWRSTWPAPGPLGGARRRSPHRRPGGAGGGPAAGDHVRACSSSTSSRPRPGCCCSSPSPGRLHPAEVGTMDDLSATALPRRLNLGLRLARSVPTASTWTCGGRRAGPGVGPGAPPLAPAARPFRADLGPGRGRASGDIQDFLEEAHALLAPGGVLEITTPHFSCANSLTDPDPPASPRLFLLRLLHRRFAVELLQRRALRDRRAHPGLPARAAGAAGSPGWANRHPALYEQRFAWIWPAWFLIFKLRKMQGLTVSSRARDPDLLRPRVRRWAAASASPRSWRAPWPAAPRSSWSASGRGSCGRRPRPATSG